ncbi:MAG: hypothetical protein NVS4B9_41700 [Ktedonobacteraceae bacterium]
MKYLKIDPYKLAATIIIASATGLRVLLAAFNWPPTNSDEGTMAIMAINIAYHGEHPYMYYGQDYMGVLEAYLGAGFFHLFGSPSLFALRLGVILLVMLFFITIYVLSSLIFSRLLGLVTLAVLSVGAIPLLTRQMIATGGSSQTLLFGALAFLLAAWLAITYRRAAPFSTRLWQLAGYALFGLVVGLGMWSDMIVLPYLVMACLLLLIFCWRDLLWGWLPALLGAFLGLQPSLRFNQARGLNPLETLLKLAHGSNAVAPTTLHGILHNAQATILVSIPTATGFPFCPVTEMTFLGDNSPHSLQCTLAHASWGLGYILLVLTAVVYALFLLVRLLKRERGTLGEFELHRALVRRTTQLLLVTTALLNIVVYIFSSGPVDQPSFHARYLVGLLIATPALLAPLWSAASHLHPATRWSRARIYGGRVILALAWLILLSGTIIAFSEVPAAQAVNQQRLDLLAQLERVGIKHIYTEYWTCNNLAFASNERVICGVIDANLQPTHNRAPRYYDIVRTDPRASYACPIHTENMTTPNYNCLPALERMVAHAPAGLYQRYEFGNYVVYKPLK